MKMVKCSKTSGLIDKNFVYDFHFHLMRSPFRYRSSHSHFRFDRVCVCEFCVHLIIIIASVCMKFDFTERTF